MSKFKFFVLQDKVSKIAQIFLKFENVKHNWKTQKLKNIFFWNIVEKLALLYSSVVEKLALLLASWHADFKNWHVGTLTRLLARWQVSTWYVKMRSWHTIGTLARGHMDM